MGGLSKRNRHVYVGCPCCGGVEMQSKVTQRNVGGYDQPRTLGQLGQLTEFLLNRVVL
jgi:hypothetical protein